MIVFPNCKINIGLNIISKRDDGFHNLETIFYPLPFKEALEIIAYQGWTPETSDVLFESSGIHIEGDPENNLCIKAYRLLKKDYPQLPPVRMHLHKAIPIGAGLGGGSADGALALDLLNKQFRLGISLERLKIYALLLGSDCPFFLLNQPCFASGRGEKLEEIALDLSLFSLVLVNPGIHINTAWAFSTIIPRHQQKENQGMPLKEAIQQPGSSWKNELTNDFEKPVFELYPEIKALRDSLYEQGAFYAAMSGTGSTVFGLFEKPTVTHFPDQYMVLSC